MQIVRKLCAKWRLIRTRVPIWVEILVRRIIWELRNKYKHWRDY